MLVETPHDENTDNLYRMSYSEKNDQYRDFYENPLIDSDYASGYPEEDR